METASTAWDFWFAVRKAASILEREAEVIIKREVGITLGQFMVMSVIDAYPGPLNQTAIADHLGLTNATVSRLIESGAKSGRIRVKVDPQSRRSHLVELTAEGMHLVQLGDKALESSSLVEHPRFDPVAARATTMMLQEFIDATRGYSGHPTAGLPPHREAPDAR